MSGAPSHAVKIITPDEPSCSPARNDIRLKILQKYIRGGSIGAEIGVFKGSFTATLLTLRPEKLYAVDPFYLTGSTWKFAKGNQSTVKSLTTILSTLRDEIDSGVLVPRVEFGGPFFDSLEDHSLDWVYLDSIHTYEHVTTELYHALRVFKPGGFVMGDDCPKDSTHRFHGVYRAVMEFVDRGDLNLCEDFPAQQFITTVP